MDLSPFLGVIPDALQNLGDEIGHAWPIFVALAAFLTIAYKVCRRARKWSLDWLRHIISEQLEPIAKELQPNHGSSLRDAINEISASVTGQADLLQQVHLTTVSNEARVKTLTDGSDQAIYEWDASGVITFVNGAYLELTGLSEADVYGGLAWSVIDEHDVQRVRDNARRAVDGHATWIDRFTIINAETNEHIPIKVYAYPRLDVYNQLLGYSGILVRQD